MGLAVWPMGEVSRKNNKLLGPQADVVGKSEPHQPSAPSPHKLSITALSPYHCGVISSSLHKQLPKPSVIKGVLAVSSKNAWPSSLPSTGGLAAA